MAKSSLPQSVEGIASVTVAGFKSIAREQTAEFRPLTLLAGATSSGKSSLMRPLLLLKQTLEAQYDPGALLLDEVHPSLADRDVRPEKGGTGCRANGGGASCRHPSACRERAAKAALRKDFLLIQAALATDGRIVSADETVRGLLRTCSADLRELRELVWVNPNRAEEMALVWLAEGARLEAAPAARGHSRKECGEDLQATPVSISTPHSSLLSTHSHTRCRQVAPHPAPPLPPCLSAG